MKTIEIALSDLHFHARHGVFKQENIVGNEFIVALNVRIPFTDGIDDDDLDATISYADLYDIIADEMKRPRKLLETVANDICLRICGKWPQILSGEITICKSTPPIPGITGNASVSIIFLKIFTKKFGGMKKSA